MLRERDLKEITAKKQKEQEEKDKASHRKTIFTGGYSQEKDQCLHGYTEGNIV